MSPQPAAKQTGKLKTRRYRCERCHRVTVTQLRLRRCHLPELVSSAATYQHSPYRCDGRLVRIKRVKPVKTLDSEIAHASKMATRWATNVKRAVTLMSYWNRRERYLVAKQAAGPRGPQPKKEKPPTRGFRFVNKDKEKDS